MKVDKTDRKLGATSNRVAKSKSKVKGPQGKNRASNLYKFIRLYTLRPPS